MRPANSDKPQQPAKELPDGVYAVLRDFVIDIERGTVPIKDGEALVAFRHRFQWDNWDAPRFVVVRSAPDVNLDLVGEPNAEKDGKDAARILLKLQPKAAAALERLTSDAAVQRTAVVVGGEVATMHKVREPIKGGEVQITSCAPGAATYLHEQLQTHQTKRPAAADDSAGPR